MHDRTARVFSGLGVLVVVWIVVYWAWPAHDAAAEFSPGPLAGLDDIELADDEAAPLENRPERFVPEVTEKAVVQTPTERPAVGGVVAPEFDDYVVRSGDNFERIALRVYGTRRHAMAIARSNPLLDPRKLRAGQTIRVPRDPANIQGQPVDDGSDSGDEPVATGPAPTIEYTVQSGDSLGKIARSFYGSITYVDFLYQANRDRLASKDDLRLGQVLLIPPLPTGAGED